MSTEWAASSANYGRRMQYLSNCEYLSSTFQTLSTFPVPFKLWVPFQYISSTFQTVSQYPFLLYNPGTNISAVPFKLWVAFLSIPLYTLSYSGIGSAISYHLSNFDYSLVWILFFSLARTSQGPTTSIYVLPTIREMGYRAWREHLQK